MGLHATELARSKVLEQETNLRGRIEAWYAHQALYMPSVAVLRLQDVEKRDRPEAVYAIRLYLPSEVGDQVECSPVLHEYEWALREASAKDQLEMLRSHLRMYAFLEGKQRQGIGGVAASTRAQNTIKACRVRIKGCAERYRKAYHALRVLGPMLQKNDKWCLQFKDLKAEDIRPVSMGYKRGEGSVVLSWIWLDGGFDPHDPESVNDGLFSS